MYRGYRYNKDGTIIVTDDWKGKHVSIPKDYKPYAIIETDTLHRNGYYQIDRTIYDNHGKMSIQIHLGHHSKPQKHKYGSCGEHKHIYRWDYEKQKFIRTTKELSEADRMWNKDIMEGIKMVNLKQLELELETNDVSFSYKEKDYVICPMDKLYAGEAGIDEDESFDTFEDMSQKWILEGKPLKDIINRINLL